MKCVYPGTFDPISNGHVDIIARAAKMFDEVHVVVSYNIAKGTSFTVVERIEMLKKATVGLTNVVITSWDGLVVSYCKNNGIQFYLYQN